MDAYLLSVAKFVVRSAAPAVWTSNVEAGFSPRIEDSSHGTVGFATVIHLFLGRRVDRSTDPSFRHTGHGLKSART
jgi:hypothetical protein